MFAREHIGNECARLRGSTNRRTILICQIYVEALSCSLAVNAAVRLNQPHRLCGKKLLVICAVDARSVGWTDAISHTSAGGVAQVGDVALGRVLDRWALGWRTVVPIVAEGGSIVAKESLFTWRKRNQRLNLAWRQGHARRTL